MNNIAWLYLLSILGIIIDLVAAFILFMMFIMPAQAFFLSQFVIVCLFFIALFLSSLFGLFTFKKWGKNIFVVLTLVMSSLVWFLFFKLNIFVIVSVGFIIFSLIFILYFTHTSVNENETCSVNSSNIVSYKVIVI
ncbi:MAG: hypothetical protein WC554_13840 [Clostridia bacterium]